jgi:predicted alpha/beta hydrolase family esterase
MTTLFIIPGFKEDSSHQRYHWLKNELSKNFKIIFIQINWNNKTMSDYIEQFCYIYKSNKGTSNYVLGFSYGAMIALLSAKRTNPNKLLLCSLSPYFSEDIPTMNKCWKAFIGKRRVNDFKLHSAEMRQLI